MIRRVEGQAHSGHFSIAAGRGDVRQVGHRVWLALRDCKIARGCSTQRYGETSGLTLKAGEYARVVSEGSAYTLAHVVIGNSLEDVTPRTAPPDEAC